MEPQIYGDKQDSAPLVFTEAAARKVGQLLQEEDNSALMLRVYISGGGCSGFQYGFTFDDQREEGDASVEQLGVTLLVGSTSMQYP
ncbi:MAG: iron-sulfur cluster assembly accessory protein, partial [Gammaproteobacteria bacterium]|nr:iron-sulfur cluster assembly accessory protein [Gammaproteobacteria bacterium]